MRCSYHCRGVMFTKWYQLHACFAGVDIQRLHFPPPQCVRLHSDARHGRIHVLPSAFNTAWVRPGPGIRHHLCASRGCHVLHRYVPRALPHGRGANVCLLNARFVGIYEAKRGWESDRIVHVQAAVSKICKGLAAQRKIPWAGVFEEALAKHTISMLKQRSSDLQAGTARGVW